MLLSSLTGGTTPVQERLAAKELLDEVGGVYEADERDSWLQQHCDCYATLCLCDFDSPHTIYISYHSAHSARASTTCGMLELSQRCRLTLWCCMSENKPSTLSTESTELNFWLQHGARLNQATCV